MTDQPRDLMVRRANYIRAKYRDTVSIYFKFTCGECCERVTFREPNTIYEYGECYKCGQKTLIDKCGFMVVMSLGGTTHYVPEVSEEGDDERVERETTEGSGETGSH